MGETLGTVGREDCVDGWTFHSNPLVLSSF